MNGMNGHALPKPPTPEELAAMAAAHDQRQQQGNAILGQIAAQAGIAGNVTIVDLFVLVVRKVGQLEVEVAKLKGAGPRIIIP
jgi:hypothetical protein